MKKLNIEQIKSVVKLIPKERYMHSLKMIADYDELFSLLDSEGDWVIAAIENRESFFIWSAEEYAGSLLTHKQWEGCKVEKVELDEFLEEIIVFLRKNNILLNVFPVDNLSGFIVTADEFTRDINIELEQYG